MADTFGKAIVALSNSAPYVNQSVPLATWGGIPGVRPTMNARNPAPPESLRGPPWSRAIIVYGMIETSPVVPSRKNFFTIGSGDRKT